MRLRLTRGPLVCLRHVTLFLYCVLQRLLRREETYLTINSPNNHHLLTLYSDEKKFETFGVQANERI